MIMSAVAFAKDGHADQSSQANFAQPHVVLPDETITAEAQVKQSLGVSNINQADLDRTPVKSDISDIVRKMPGVNLTGNSATGQRGNNRQIDIRGMGPENTLVLVDGKPITSRNSVRYGWQGERDTRGDSQWIPANAIEKIEVLRGPSATRYGSGAMGVVVNIITKPVSDELAGTAEIYINQPQNSKEGDSWRVGASLSGAIIADKLGFRLYGGLNKTDMDAVDINPLVPYTTPNGTYLTRSAGREGVENKDVGLRLTYQISPDHSLTFDATYGQQGNKYAGDTQNSNRDATAISDSQTQSNALLNSLIGSQTNRMRRDSYSLTYDGAYDWGDGKLTLQHDQTKNTRLNEGLSGGPEGVIFENAANPLRFETTELTAQRLHGEIVKPFYLGVPQTVTLGVEYVHDKLIDNANTDEGTATGTVSVTELDAQKYTTGDRSTMTSRIMSAYAENNLAVTKNTDLVLSARYDHHNKSGGNFSPAINLTHHLTDAWTLKAGVARAYKAPNLYQNAEGYLLYTRGQGCPIHLSTADNNRCVLQGNSDLKPETSINTEFGVQYQHGDINASATYFHSDYKNKIVAGTTSLSSDIVSLRGVDYTYNLLKWESTPKAVVEGIEGNLTWQRGDWRINNNLTYMINSKDKQTGNPLSLVPTYTWNTSVGYDINDKWDVNATYTQYGRQKVRQFAQSNIENLNGNGLLNNQDVKGYGIFSVNTGYYFNDHVSGRIGINNVFDKQRLRDNTISQSYNEAGRSYFASLRYEF